MSELLHRKIIGVVLSLYIVATWSSMAGMEILGWLLFALTMTYAFRTPKESPAQLSDFSPYLPWRSMIAIVLITIVGIYVNGTPEADKLAIIGSQRWVFLLVSSSFALMLSPPKLRGYRFFLFFATVIAIYAIFQADTGIDLLRPGSNRAVQPLDIRSDLRFWRSAGLFGSPMAYVYIAGMYSCLPLAVAFVFPKPQNRLRLISFLVFLVVAASLVTTFVRGGWIAMVIAYAVMAWMTSRKLFSIALAAFAATFASLFVFQAQFHERVMSLFNPQYTSNNDRWNLWKMNWAMFKDYPILGIGWEENETRACDYVNCNVTPKPFTGHAHNNYLQALSGTGILGFAAYMTFIGFFLWLTWRTFKRLPLEQYWARAIVMACFGAQLILHIGGFTECNFKAGATKHNLLIVYGLVSSIAILQAKGLLSRAYGEVTISKGRKSA